MALSEKQANQLNSMLGRLTAESQYIQKKSQSITLLNQKIQFLLQDSPKDPMTEELLSKATIDKIFTLITAKFNEKFPVTVPAD